MRPAAGFLDGDDEECRFIKTIATTGVRSVYLDKVFSRFGYKLSPFLLANSGIHTFTLTRLFFAAVQNDDVPIMACWARQSRCAQGFIDGPHVSYCAHPSLPPASYDSSNLTHAIFLSRFPLATTRLPTAARC